MALIILAVLVTAHRLFTTWEYVHDVYNGGGVPPLDWIIVAPAFLAFSIRVLLTSMDAMPFHLFGLVLFFVLMLIATGVYRVLDWSGKPIREAKARAMQESRNIVRDTLANLTGRPQAPAH
jgi:hypothetical protein